MPVGRISSIIDYAGNYYVLKVEDKRGGTTRSLAEARADIEKKLIQDEAAQIQERWIAASAKRLISGSSEIGCGYGQKFTDAISRDWVGKPYVDAMKGLDYVEKTLLVYR